MIFMDFEASGLQGFPIEIGWAEVRPDRTIVTESHLILCDRWMDQIERWDAGAEAIHHIPRNILLEFGKPPEEVARRTNEALAGSKVCVDSPYDKKWTKELFDEARLIATFELVDVAVGFEGSEIDEMAYEYARRFVDQVQRKTHRAADDARHWASLYRMSLKSEVVPRNMRDTAK